MRLVMSAAVAAALFAGGAAFAKEKKPEDPDKIVCKFEQQTGSRFGHKVCKTRAEWKALEDEARAGVDATYRPIRQPN